MRMQCLTVLLFTLVASCFSNTGIKNELTFSRTATQEKLDDFYRAVDGPSLRAAIDDKVRALLEKMRLTMNSSNPSLGLPTLDPLVLTDVDIAIHKDVADLSGILPFISVRNISTFQLDSISVKLILLSASFGFYVAEVSASGTYNITGTIGHLLPVFGTGPFTVQLMGLNVTDGYLKLGYTDGSLFLKTITFDYSIDSVKLQLENLLGGGSLGAAVNQMLNDLAPQLLADYKQDIIRIASSTVTNIVDKFLHGKSASDLLGIINNS